MHRGGTTYLFLNHKADSTQPLLTSENDTPLITTSTLLKKQNPINHKIEQEIPEQDVVSVNHDLAIKKKAEQLIQEADALIAKENLRLPDTFSTDHQKQLNQIDQILTYTENELSSLN